MDNTIIPYQDDSDESYDSSTDSSTDNDEYSHLLSNNIGIHYNNHENQNNFVNMEKPDKYIEKRNKYFTPEISKYRILVDSKNIDHNINHSTSNYIIYFEGLNQTNNTSGYGIFNNVIGFKLIKAIIPNSAYNVNTNNNHIIIQMTDETTNDINIYLTPGKYTFTELKTHLLDILNNSPYSLNFNIDSNESILKYTITNNTSFRIKWNDSNGYSYRLFGFLNINSEFTNSLHSNNVVQQSTHFVDLVIPEIPYITCKKNNYNKNIIERIPLDNSLGSIIHYSNDINLDNYFFPINIDKINIQLYEDTTEFLYECQNSDNSFEFEITILNKNN